MEVVVVVVVVDPVADGVVLVVVAVVEGVGEGDNLIRLRGWSGGLVLVEWDWTCCSCC